MESMDRVLAYRNFLAAEDHLDELMDTVSSSSEKQLLDGLKCEIEHIRDGVMPAETKSEFHCVVKHLSAAYEACREIAKTTHGDDDKERVAAVRHILIAFLEMLWDRKIITCERCGADGIQTSIGTNNEGASSNGEPAGAIQSVGDGGVTSIRSSEEPRISGDYTGWSAGTD